VGTHLVAGAGIVGPSLGVTGGTITWLLMRRWADLRERERAGARKRTLLRYAAASPGARGAVGRALVSDPLLTSLVALPGPLGRVVDVGAGFGHVGLALFDLGLAETVLGIDDDPARVAVARAAAGSDAQFEEGNLETFEFPEADTVLFIDSLRYLPVDVQDRVLAGAARRLAPGGRLIIRELDAVRSWRSSVSAELGKRAARKKPALGLRTPRDLVGRLRALGFECENRPHEAWSLLETGLVVATKSPTSATHPAAGG